MTLLNFQNRDGKIKPYQVQQLQLMIDKYWTVDEHKPTNAKRESKKRESKR
jgi:hypothetical protein